MYLSQEHIIELWKMRLHVLEMRRPSWLLETIWITLGCFLVMSFISQYKIRTILFIIVPYIIVASLIYILEMKLKRKTLYIDYPYHLSIILYQIYDQISAFLFSFSFWAIGLRFLVFSKVFTNTIMQRGQSILVFSLLALILLTILFSPKLTRQGAEANLSSNQNMKLMPRVLNLLSIVPSVGVVVGILLSHSKNQRIDLAILSVIFLSIGYFVMPLMLLAFCRLIILIFQKWPVIRKIGDRYVVDRS